MTENLKDRYKNTEILGHIMSVPIPSNISNGEFVAKSGLGEVDKLVEHSIKFIPEPENNRIEHQTYRKSVLATCSYPNMYECGDIEIAS